MKIIGTFKVNGDYSSHIGKKIFDKLKLSPGDEVVILQEDGKFFMRKNE